MVQTPPKARRRKRSETTTKEPILRTKRRRETTTKEPILLRERKRISENEAMRITRGHESKVLARKSDETTTRTKADRTKTGAKHRSGTTASAVSRQGKNLVERITTRRTKRIGEKL